MSSDRDDLARITLDAMGSFVGLLDPQGRVLELNKTALDAVGLQLSDVVGKAFWDTTWWQVSEDVRTTLRDAIGRAAAGETVRWHTQICGGAEGRQAIVIDASLTPVRAADGRIAYVCAELRDITEKQAREEGLRHAAESANRAKDEFLAILGHELRNPLSPILTALELMKLRGDAGAERERTVIERQITHLTRLVDDLLDVSRIARGKVELKTEVVETHDIVTRAIEMASPLLEHGNHSLVVEVPRRGLRVDGDVTRLSQVVSNLLTNAAKYTPAGGTITVVAAERDGDVTVSVRDTGIGIAADMLPRIFDLFVQERQALDRAQGGLGLGLTIVRNLIERHGGTVSARSDGPGTGSEFIVRVPSARRGYEATDRMPALTLPDEGVAPVIPTARILVVDDNEDGAELLAEVLSAKGYATRIAHDAPTALRVAAEFVPQLAFLDLGLPVMDGYELASHLRALPGLAGLRLIAVTGYGQDSDRRRTQDAGFDHHLVKPVDLAAIEAALVDARPTSS
jgi:PAS domain S-box-containing protein